MSKENVVTIEHIEIKKSDIEKVKKFFKIKDNAAAIKKAIDVISGNIELKAIFEKHRGVKIKKVYD
ncbi:MAG: hypothetical protein AABY58_11195 [Nitrospirota bacterium]